MPTVEGLTDPNDHKEDLHPTRLNAPPVAKNEGPRHPARCRSLKSLLQEVKVHVEIEASPVARSLQQQPSGNDHGQGGDAGFGLSFGYAQDSTAEEEEARNSKIASNGNNLPSLISLFLVLVANFLFNVSFYVIIPTATQYSKSLGGGSVFSGLVIGGVTFTSTVMLIPLSKLPIFRHYYRPTLDLAAISLCVGNILYAIANRTNFLYLILIGRLVSGLGFTGWFFVKRYCTDVRFVGIQRRTMCSNVLVAAQTLGMVIGPILGGLLANIHVNTRLINANTLPGWVMAASWLVYWIMVRLFFKEEAVVLLQKVHTDPPMDTQPAVAVESRLTYRTLIVIGVMCYCAFTVFFDLGAWEAEIPIFSRNGFGWSVWDAGYFIGLVGLASFFLIFPLTFVSKRIQDRKTLAFGILIGGLGILLHMCLLKVRVISRVWYGVSWFLVCWGFNLASTITLSLLSKSLPDRLSDKAALAIQISNYMGRFTGAIWGTMGSTVGDVAIAALEVGNSATAVITVLGTWSLLKVCNG